MPELAHHHRTPLGRATIGDQLRRHARTQPHKLAVISYDPSPNPSYNTDAGRRETTYAELDRWANRFAQLFLALGIGRGGRIASMSGNRVDVVAAYYGALSGQPGFGPDSVGQVRRCMTYGGRIPPPVLDAWAAAAPDLAWGTAPRRPDRRPDAAPDQGGSDGRDDRDRRGVRHPGDGVGGPLLPRHRADPRQ
jgi:hypothetical protein